MGIQSSMGYSILAVALKHWQAGDALEIVSMALAGICAEGHLVGVAVVAQRYGFAGDGGKAAVVGVAASADYPCADLQLMQMELRRPAVIIVPSYNLSGILRAVLCTLHAMPRSDIP